MGQRAKISRLPDEVCAQLEREPVKRDGYSIGVIRPASMAHSAAQRAQGA